MSVMRAVVAEYRSRWFFSCAALAVLTALDVAAISHWFKYPRFSAATPSATASRPALPGLPFPSQLNTKATAAPRLELSTTKLNLGDGKPMEILRGELTLTNRGSSSESFSLVKHCGCTELSPMSGDLAAGASETIHVGIELPSVPNSEKNTWIEVQAGDPSTTVAACVLSGRCPGRFLVEPAFVSFGSLGLDEIGDAATEIHLRPVEGQPPLDPEAIVIGHDDHAFSVERLASSVASDTSSIAALRVRLAPTLSPGDHRETLEIRLAGSDYSVRVPLTVRVTDAISVVPRTVSLRRRSALHNYKPVRLLVIDRRLDGNLGPVTLVEGPPGLMIEDLGDAARGYRLLRVLLGSETSIWPDENRVRFGADGTTFEFTLSMGP